jgi:phosphate transport system ATP-binding protein
MDTNAEPGNGTGSGKQHMSENAAENTPDGQYEPPGYPSAPDAHTGGQTYGIYPDEGTPYPEENGTTGLPIMSPRPAETAVLEYGRPGDPLLVPSRLVGLDARNISAWFGTHKVLERVSLSMEPGTVTALIGPSGCGKSTFLRILNRMHEMISGASLGGQVMLGERDIYDQGTRPSDVRRRIGMVFQKPNPFPSMSIYDNVASGLKLAGIKVSNKDAVVEASLRRAGLWNEVHRRLRAPGGGLSGGQQQRLCIARALAVKPDVLLMDEPCSALDPTSTRRIEETIAELENQVTIVIVTHNMQQAQRVSRNCAFFLAAEDTPGHIVESGPTEQVFNNPNDPRTADYVNGRFG